MQKYAASWKTSSDPWGEWIEVYEALRISFANFINAHPDEVAIVTGASAGINPIANARPFGKRNRVVMGRVRVPGHGPHLACAAAARTEIQFLAGAANSIPSESYDRVIDERTLIVPLTHVSFLNGYRSDVANIPHRPFERIPGFSSMAIRMAAPRPLDIKALDVDFYVTGTLKYLLGPPGLGSLYVRRVQSKLAGIPATSPITIRIAVSPGPITEFNHRPRHGRERRRCQRWFVSLPNISIHASLPLWLQPLFRRVVFCRLAAGITSLRN